MVGELRAVSTLYMLNDVYTLRRVLGYCLHSKEKYIYMYNSICQLIAQDTPLTNAQLNIFS